MTRRELLDQASKLKEAIDPRVALVGPKSSGKTIYRSFLSAVPERLPPYLQHTLGAASAPFGRERGMELTYSSDKGWSWEREVLPAAPHTTRDGHGYLRRAVGTNWMTGHTLSVPGMGPAGASGSEPWVIDFCGEHATTALHQDLEEAWHELLAQDRALIARCRLVLFFLPFRLLFPPAFRRCPPPHLESMYRMLSESREVAGAAEEWRRQQDVVVETAGAWLDFLHPVFERSRPPMLLVVVSMLGADWQLDLCPELQGTAAALADSLARARLLLREPLARGARDADPLPQLRGVAPGLRGYLGELRDAAALRRLLGRLDAELARAMELSVELWRQSGGHAGARLARDLGFLAGAAGRSRVRYTAMNIISERHLLVPSAGSSGPEALEYLRLDPAGADFPGIYLCGNADLLA